MEKPINDIFEFTERIDYERKIVSQIKEKLGDSLCKYCPFTNGEIDKKCDSQCDGRYCEKALGAYLDSDNDDDFEKMLGIIKTTEDELPKYLKNNTGEMVYSNTRVDILCKKDVPKGYILDYVCEAKDWCGKSLKKSTSELGIKLGQIHCHVYRVGDRLYTDMYGIPLKG